MARTFAYNHAIAKLYPTAQWFLENPLNYDTLKWESADIPKPSKAELDAEIALLNSTRPLQECSNKAKELISKSDWAVLPDVGITNVTEFETYRAALRALIKNPVAEPTFPTEPQPIWA